MVEDSMARIILRMLDMYPQTDWCAVFRYLNWAGGGKGRPSITLSGDGSRAAAPVAGLRAPGGTLALAPRPRTRADTSRGPAQCSSQRRQPAIAVTAKSLQQFSQYRQQKVFSNYNNCLWENCKQEHKIQKAANWKGTQVSFSNFSMKCFGIFDSLALSMLWWLK